MKITFTQDGGFEINYTSEEISNGFQISETAFTSVCKTAEKRMEMMKDISVRNMELQSQFAIHNSNILSLQNTQTISENPEDIDFGNINS